MTRFRAAFERPERIAKRPVTVRSNGLTSTVSLFAPLLLIGMPGAKEEGVEALETETNWEPNSLSGPQRFLKHKLSLIYSPE